MSGRTFDGRLDRAEEETRDVGASDPADASPQARLLTAARKGRFEKLVAQARPAQPVRMVTPEEREAALRAAGQWPAEKAAPPQKAPEETPAPEPTQELTPNQAFIAEHCRWVPSHERDDGWARSTYGRVLTEYDPLTGDIIGDGYIRHDEDDEE